MSARIQNKQYMTICSEKTLQSNERGFFMQFAETVAQTAGETWIKNTFGKLKNDRDRIRVIYHDATVKEVVVSTLSHVQEIFRRKNAEISQARRLEAEKVFKAGDSVKALMLCSQSVLRAPKTGETPKIDNGISLALALWQRSEILMNLKKYSLALADLQLTLKEGMHNTHKAEVFWRMAICYKAMGELKRSEVSTNLAEKLLLKDPRKIEALKESLTKDYREAKKVIRKIKPSIPNIHPEYPNATKKLLVKHEADKGRFVVATNDISTGETIICEPPYAACLLPECFGTHCHHCFERFDAPIGCPNCSGLAFCSVECRDAALNSYHKFECKYLDLLIGSGMSVLSHTALRMATQNNPEKMYELNKNRSLEKVYSLCTLGNQRNPEDYLQRTLMAAFLLRCLQMSGYFGYVDENVVPNENQLGVGELLLFHLQMLQFNAHEIYETKHSDKHRFRSAIANYIGVAVYPTASLLNHDCSPTVSRHFVGKNIVIKAVRPLKSGEAISENYGPIFTRRSLADRQRSLLGRYWFRCQCLACVQNWPSLETGLVTLSKRIRCTTTNCPNLFTLPVSNETVTCPQCKHKVVLTANILQLRNCEEQYLNGFDCMDRHAVDKGIGILCRALDSFFRISAPPHKDTHLAQECLRALMADSGNVHEVPITKDVKK